jgi:hypothetical protein
MWCTIPEPIQISILLVSISLCVLTVIKWCSTKQITIEVEKIDNFLSKYTFFYKGIFICTIISSSKNEAEQSLSEYLKQLKNLDNR